MLNVEKTQKRTGPNNTLHPNTELLMLGHQCVIAWVIARRYRPPPRLSLSNPAIKSRPPPRLSLSNPTIKSNPFLSPSFNSSRWPNEEKGETRRQKERDGAAFQQVLSLMNPTLFPPLICQILRNSFRNALGLLVTLSNQAITSTLGGPVTFTPTTVRFSLSLILPFEAWIVNSFWVSVWGFFLFNHISFELCHGYFLLICCVTDVSNFHVLHDFSMEFGSFDSTISCLLYTSPSPRD